MTKLTVVTVNVTADDIKAGKRKKIDRCAVALAAKRAFKEARWAIGDEIVYAPTGCDRLAATPLPPSAQKFIKAFDERRVVKPFAFEVSVWI